MKQTWFQGSKHEHCRAQIELYKAKVKYAYLKADNEIKERQISHRSYTFKRNPEHQSFRDESNRSEKVINRFRERQRKYFKSNIEEELIASAMKPCRIEAQMNQFDNIEDFFEAIGC